MDNKTRHEQAEAIACMFLKNASHKDCILILMQEGLIPEQQSRNYMINLEYEAAIKQENYRHTDIAADLAVKYELTDRRVRGIIYSYNKKKRK